MRARGCKMYSLRPSPAPRERGDPARRAGWVRVYDGNHPFDFDHYDVSGSIVEIPGDRLQIGGRPMAGAIRKSPVRQGPLSGLKDDLSRFLREGEKHEIVMSRQGKPAGGPIGF